MAGENDFLLRFRVDLSQAEAELNAFSAKARSQIQSSASTPIPNIPIPPGITSGTELSAGQAGAAFGASKQQFLQESAAAGLIASPAASALPPGLETQLNNAIIKSLGIGNTLSGFKKNLTEEQGKEFSQGTIAGASTVRKNIADGEAVVQAKVQELIGIKTEEVQAAAKASASEVSAAKAAELEAKGKKAAAEAQIKKTARLQESTRLQQDPNFVAEIIANAEAKAATELAASEAKKRAKADARAAAAAAKTAASYEEEARLHAIQLESEAKQTIAANRAVLAKTGLVAQLGEAGATDQLLSSSINAERAKYFRNNPDDRNTLVKNDFEQRREAAIQAGQLDQQLVADREYIQGKTESAAATKKEAALVSSGVAEKLAADQEYQAAVLQNIRAREVERLEILKGTTEEDIARRGEISAIQTAEKEKIRLAELEILSSEEYLSVKAQRIVAERALNKALREQVAAELAANGDRFGALTVKYGRGGLTGGGNGTDVGSAFGGGLFSSLTHILPTVALFGALAGLGSSLKEFEKLQVIFNQLDQQAQSLGQQGSLGDLKESILDIAKAAGESSPEVASLAFQFQGAFGGNTQKTIHETQAAVEAVKVTGLSLAETTDSFTAITQSFKDQNVSIADVSDTALGLQERFGVLAKETIQFSGNLAPVASQIGLTSEKLETLGAVAQKYSGRTGQQLADSFGRIFPAMQKNAIQVIALFDQIGKKDIGDQLGKAFGSGQTGEAFEILLKNYKDLTQAQKNYVIEQLGGRREAQAIIPLLEHADEYYSSLAKGQEDAGKTAEYFAQIQGTLSQKLAILGETLKQIGIKLFSGGLGQALTALASGAAGLFSILGSVVSVASSLNEHLGGIPLTLLAIVAAMRGLSAITTVVASGFQKLAASKTTDTAATEANTIATAENAAAQGTDAAAVATAGAATGLSRVGGRFGFGGLAGIKRNFATGYVDSLGAGPSFLVNGKALDAEAGAASGALSKVTGGANKLAAGMGGLANALPPGLVFAGAALAVGALVNKIIEVRDNLGEWDQKITDAVNATPGPENRQKKIDEIAAAQGQFSNLELGGLYLTGNKSPLDLANELNAQKKAPGSQKALEELLKSGQFEDLGIFQGTGFNGTRNTLKNSDLQTLIDELKANPSDTALQDKASGLLNATVDTLRKQGKGDLASALERFYSDGINEAEGAKDEALKVKDEKQKAAEAINTTADSLESIKSQVASGQIGYGSAVAKIDQVLQYYQQLALGGDADEEQQKKAIELQTARKEFISTAVLQQAEDVSKLKQAFGQTATPQETIDALNKALDSGQLNPADRKKATDDLIKAYKDLYDFRKQQVDTLGTEAEQLDLIQNGVQVDPGTKLSILESQLQTADSQFEDFKSHQTDNVNEVLDQSTGIIASLILNEGLTVQQAVQRVLKDQIEIDKRALEAKKAAGASQAELDAIQQKINEEQSAIDAAGSADLGTVSAPDKYVEDAAKQAKEALDVQKKFRDARVAYFKALNPGDSIAAAEADLAAAQEELNQAKPETLEWYAAATKVASANESLRRAIKSRTDSKFEYLKALNSDDARVSAQIDLQQALADLATASPDEYFSALAKVAQANQQIKQANEAYTQAKFSYYKQLYSDDPLQSAQIELQAANEALSQAKPDTEAYYQALSRVDAANKAIRDAQRQTEDAQSEYAKALVSGDPVKQAALDQKDAIRHFAEAKNDAERLKALADKIKADQDFVKAQRAILDAQSEYLQALAGFKGDTVGKDQLVLAEAKRHLQEVLADKANGKAGDADVINAQKAVLEAQGQLRDDKLQKSLDDYSFLYDMGKITQTQYIQYLKKLKALPDLTTEELRSIDRQIKQLQDQLNQDLQFNVPSEIKLPVLYEARRLNQGGGAGYQERGSIGYQDNRNVQIEINVKDGMDKSQVVEIINDAVGSQNRFSQGTRRY